MKLLDSFLSFLFWVYSQLFYRKPIQSNGRAILVTGAASGIGRATVDELLSRGCHVFAADLDENSLKSRYSHNMDVTVIRLDVTSPQSVQSALSEVKKAGKGLYGIVNSAGVGRTPNNRMVKAEPELDVDEDVLPIFQVNTFGVMRVNSAFFPLILESKGAFVNVVSVAGRIPMLTTYSESKFALNAYTSILARHLRPKGLRAVSIEPGWVDTPLVTNLFKDLDYSKSVFEDQLKAGAERIKDGLKNMMLSPTMVATAIADALFDPNPRVHQLVDTPFRVLMWSLLSILPLSVVDWIQSRL